MKLIEVEVKNIKRAKWVHFRPKPVMTKIGGMNTAGKTSTIDAPAYAIGGAKLCPEQPIREGESEAFVECLIGAGDGTPAFKVRRTFERREDGTIRSTLQIWDEDGQLAPSPQSILNDALGRKRIGHVPIGFDPLAFSRMKPKEQAAMLREIMGIDFADLDEAHAKAYEARREINLKVRTLKAHVDQLPRHDDAPAKRIEDSELQRQLDAAAAINSQNATKRREAEHAAGKVRELEARHAEKLRQRTNLEKQLLALKDGIEKLSGEIKGLKDDSAEMDEKVAKLQDIETADIARQLSAAHKSNAKVADNERHAAAVETLIKMDEQAVKAEDELQRIAAERDKRLAAAPWPIEGLGFSADGVTYRGRPFEQASSAEQLEASAAIGFAANPELKLLFVREGSLLDEDHVQSLADLAEKHGGQVILERVGEGECHVLMRDGEAVEIAEECRPAVQTEFAAEPEEDS